MGFRQTVAASAVAVMALAGANARATTLLSDTDAPVERAVGSAFDETFDSATGGLASLSFVLDGYRSLDGQNWYEDDFTLSLNNVAIIKGTWNLGGGGSDAVYMAPTGATFDNLSGNGAAVTWTGGHVNISSSLNLLAGGNTLTFSYGSLGVDHAGLQGQADEAWSVHDVLVTQANRFSGTDLVGVVPEPGTWMLMLVGLGGAGLHLRHRRRAPATA
jgi:hypothetical protein